MLARKTKGIAIAFIVLLAVGVCVGLYLTLTKRSSHIAAIQKVTIAQAGDFFLYAPLYIASDAGLFSKNGLEVRLISTGGDEKTWAAVISGDAQFGVADPTFVAISETRGQPGRVIASIVNGVPFWGITFEESVQPIKNPTELKNYTVGTFPSPSTAYTLQKRMFTEAGLEPRIREGAFGTMLAMLKAKQVDIALELEPNVSQAVAQGAHVVYSLADRYGDFAITGLTTTPALIDSKPEFVRAVSCSIQQALGFIRAEPNRTLEILQRRFPEIDSAIAKSALDRVVQANIIPETVVISRDAWKKAIDLRVEVGDISTPSRYEQFIYDVEAKWAANTCQYKPNKLVESTTKH